MLRVDLYISNDIKQIKLCNILKMSSSNSFPDNISLHMALEQEQVVERRRKQAYSEFVRGREALRMREFIDDFEDFSFMQQADMRRTTAYSMRMKEQQEMEAQRSIDARALKEMHKEEVYKIQQQEEAIQIRAALRSARENMQQNAVAAGNFPSPLAIGYLDTNVDRFSEFTRNRILLQEQGLRERALASAHAERMRLDVLKNNHKL